MPSAVESVNRKIHIYLGLFFLFFLWLFSLSGVVLNHPKWRFAGFWDERRQSTYEIPVTFTAGGEELAAARELIGRLGIRGEVAGPINHAGNGEWNFRVVRPGDIYEIKAVPGKGSATINRTHVNVWGISNMLHSFTGVRRTDPELHQNWWATGMWRFSMDALAVSLAIMVLSGIYMWFGRLQRRLYGALALALGVATLAAFLLA